jgi:hexosaminidase
MQTLPLSPRCYNEAVSIDNPQDIEIQLVQRFDAATEQLLPSLVIINRGESELAHQGWRLYFSLGLTLADGEVRARTEIIDGRYGYLEPGAEWTRPGTDERVELALAPWLFAGMKLGARQGFYLTRTGPDMVEELLGSPTILEPIVDELPKLANSWIRDTSPACDFYPQTPRRIYDKNLFAQARSDATTIIPAAKNVRFEQHLLDLTAGFKVDCDRSLENERAYLVNLLRTCGPQSESGVSVKLSLIEDLGLESYRLTVDHDGISIAGADPAAVFYGIQSLRQLLADGALPHATVADSPDWPHRALFLDIARHFLDEDAIIKIIRAMAAYKMNRLQLGISNDEAWRLEVPSIPELTSIGGRRQHQVLDESGQAMALRPAWGDNHEPYEGYLSRQAMVRILKTAASHHVEIILEFNLPGHANAIIQSLSNSTRFQLVDPGDKSAHRSAQGYTRNVVNVCMESTYRFVAAVLEDILQTYTLAGVDLRTLHFGGDEVPNGAWLGSPLVHECTGVWNPNWSMDDSKDVKAARRHLMEHHYRKLTETAESIIPGIELGFWHEMAPYAEDSSSNNRRYFNVWATEAGQEASVQRILSRNQKMVICNASYLYLDMPYGMHMDEPGLPWAAYIDTELIYHFDPLDSWNIGEDSKRLVAGLQAQLWSETVFDTDLADFYLFPRLLAVAERAWNCKPQPSRWSEFANAISKRELNYLETHNVHFRVPPPGAIYEEGILSANVLFPDLTISFTIDGSEPQIDSTHYHDPVALDLPADGEIKLRAFTSSGRGSRTVTVPATRSAG